MALLEREPRRPTLPVGPSNTPLSSVRGGELKTDIGLLFHLWSIVADTVPDDTVEVRFVWRIKNDLRRLKTITVDISQLGDPLLDDLRTYSVERPYHTNRTYQLWLEFGAENTTLLLQEWNARFIIPEALVTEHTRGNSLTLAIDDEFYRLFRELVVDLGNRLGAKRFIAEWVFQTPILRTWRTVARVSEFTLHSNFPTLEQLSAESTVLESGFYVLNVVARDISYEVFRASVRVRLNVEYLVPDTGKHMVLAAASPGSNQHQWLLYKPPSTVSYESILFALQERAAFVESVQPAGDDDSNAERGTRRWNLLRGGASLFPLIEDAELALQLTTALYTEFEEMTPTNAEIVVLAQFSLLGILTATERQYIERRAILRKTAETKQLNEGEQAEFDTHRLVGAWKPAQETARARVVRAISRTFLPMGIDSGRLLLRYKMLVSLNRLSTKGRREFTELNDTTSAFLGFESVQPSDSGIYMCFEKGRSQPDNFYTTTVPERAPNELWSLSGLFSLNVVVPTQLRVQANATSQVNLPDAGVLSSLNDFQHMWVKLDRALLPNDAGLTLPPRSVEPFAAIDANAGIYARVFLEEGASFDPLPFALKNPDGVAVKTQYAKVFRMVDAMIEVSFDGYDFQALSGSHVILDVRKLIPDTAVPTSWTKDGVGKLSPALSTGAQLTLGSVRLRHSGTYIFRYEDNNTVYVVNLRLNVRGFCARCERMVNGIENRHGACRWHTKHVYAVNGDTYLRVLDGLQISKVSRLALEKTPTGEWVEKSPRTYEPSPFQQAQAIIHSFNRGEITEKQMFGRLRLGKVLSVNAVGKLQDRAVRNPFPLALVTQLFAGGIVQRNPNRYYGLTIHPDTDLREEWLCCGEVPSHPGCWEGTHSESTVPDLHDYMNTEPLRGTEHINYPDSSPVMHALIISAFGSNQWNEGVRLEARFNQLHGGVPTLTLEFRHEGGNAALQRQLSSPALNLSETLTETVAITWLRGSDFGLWKRNDILAREHKRDILPAPLPQDMARHQHQLYTIMRDILRGELELADLPEHTQRIVIVPPPVVPEPELEPGFVEPEPEPGPEPEPVFEVPEPEPEPEPEPGFVEPEPVIQPREAELEEFTQEQAELQPIEGRPPGHHALRQIEWDLGGKASGRLFGRMKISEQDRIFESNIQGVSDLNTQAGGPLEGWETHFTLSGQEAIRQATAPLFERIPTQSQFIGDVPPIEEADLTRLQEVGDSIVEYYKDKVDPAVRTTELDILEWARHLQKHKYDFGAAMDNISVPNIQLSVWLQYFRVEFETVEVMVARIKKNPGEYGLELAPERTTINKPQWVAFLQLRLPGLLEHFYNANIKPAEIPVDPEELPEEFFDTDEEEDDDTEDVLEPPEEVRPAVGLVAPEAVDNAAAALLYLYQLVQIQRKLADMAQDGLDIKERVEIVRENFSDHATAEMQRIAKYADTTRRWQDADLYIYYWVLFRNMGRDVFIVNYFDYLLSRLSVLGLKTASYNKGFITQLHNLLDTEAMALFLKGLEGRDRSGEATAIRSVFNQTHHWSIHGALVDADPATNRGILSPRLKRLLSGTANTDSEHTVGREVAKLHEKLLMDWKIAGRLNPPKLNASSKRTRLRVTQTDDPVTTSEEWVVVVNPFTFVQLNETDWKRGPPDNRTGRVSTPAFETFLKKLNSKLQFADGKMKPSVLISTSNVVNDDVPAWVSGAGTLRGIRLYPVITAPWDPDVNTTADRIAQWEVNNPNLTMVSTRHPTVLTDKLMRTLTPAKLEFELCRGLNPRVPATAEKEANKRVSYLMRNVPETQRVPPVYSISDHSAVVTDKDDEFETAKLLFTNEPDDFDKLWEHVTDAAVAWLLKAKNRMGFKTALRIEFGSIGNELKLTKNKAVLEEYLNTKAPDWRTRYGPDTGDLANLRFAVSSELFESVRLRVAANRQIQEQLLQRLILDYAFTSALKELSSLPSYDQDNYYKDGDIVEAATRVQSVQNRRTDIWPATLYMVVENIDEDNSNVLGFAIWKQKPGMDDVASVKIGDAQPVTGKHLYDAVELSYLCISEKPDVEQNVVYALFTQGALDARVIHNNNFLVIRPAWWYDVLVIGELPPQIYETVHSNLAIIYGEKLGLIPAFVDGTINRTVFASTGPYTAPDALSFVGKPFVTGEVKDGPIQAPVVQRLIETLYYDSNKSNIKPVQGTVEKEDVRDKDKVRSSGLLFPEFSEIGLRGLELRTVSEAIVTDKDGEVDEEKTAKKTQSILDKLPDRALVKLEGKEPQSLDMFVQPNFNSEYIRKVWDRLVVRRAEAKKREEDKPVGSKYTALNGLMHQIDFIIANGGKSE